MASKAGGPCKFQIPSAPGKYRSPEEYSEADLDEKLDIYATASVFYGIITGEKAWSDLSTTETKKYVKRGVKPKIGDEYQVPGSIDAALTNLTELAYTKNPEERISASQLVAALEELQAMYPLLEDETKAKG
jgi:serine/threonine protein kinase